MVLTMSGPIIDHGSSQWVLQDRDDCQVTATLGKIEIVPMSQRGEIHDRAEDWTGKSSTALRRKLQNRLNQRASRKRKKQINTPTYQVFVPEIQSRRQSDLTYPLDLDACTIATQSGPAQKICISATQYTLESATSLPSFINTPLPVDQKLMTLLHFNLVRGLLQNVSILGLDPDLMEDDIPSPFLSIDASVITLIAKLPLALKPTNLQLTIPHHPEIDGFPYPGFRDNVIRAGQRFNSDVFCEDMLFGIESEGDVAENVTDMTRGKGRSGRTGLIVWSDPWLSGSWEVEEKFARKYAWVFRGCEEIIQSTNFWRESRGEEPLRFEEVDDLLGG